MQVDDSAWSGEGRFTQTLLDQLKTLEAIEHLRVEDAPASHTEAAYSFISNEIFVRFRTRRVIEPGRFLGLVSVRRAALQPVITLQDLEARLATLEGVGAPDYSDAGMLQYLRTERIVPPYQTRGYKLVEMVRVYRAGETPRR